MGDFGPPVACDMGVFVLYLVTGLTTDTCDIIFYLNIRLKCGEVMWRALGVGAVKGLQLSVNYTVYNSMMIFNGKK